MRSFVAVVVGGVIATSLPSGPASAARVVPERLFGQHVAQISGGVPEGLAGNVGAVRLWDAKVTWREIEVADNKYKWGALDAAVDNARRAGAREVLYTLGSTPRWAAKDRDSNLALYGPGSNSHPRSNKLYLDYLRAVAKRYKGRITAYQVWNEANLRDFYLGTPAQMATLTKQSREVLRKVDRKAKLVAASTTVRAKGPVGRWGKAYGKAMRKVNWPVHAVSAHFYPPATAGPGARASYIKVMKRYYKRWGAGRKPLWDTEMNYGDTRWYMKVKRRYTGATAQAYVARTYLDSMRYGVSRVFWYGWDHHVLGTDMTTRNGSGAITAAGSAFITIRQWLSGARWYGCTTKRKVTTCTIKPRKAKRKVTIRYASTPTTIRVPKRVRSVAYLNGGGLEVRPGDRLQLTDQPVLLR
jgi:hypothetical protein